FANRDHLEQSDLDSYAKELGLDLAKFHADAQSQATTDRIARDKKLAESLDVKGTPTIFINGRDYDPHQDLNDWLALEGASTRAGDTKSPPAPSTDDSAKTAAKADAGSSGLSGPKK